MEFFMKSYLLGTALLFWSFFSLAKNIPEQVQSTLVTNNSQQALFQYYNHQKYLKTQYELQKKSYLKQYDFWLSQQAKMPPVSQQKADVDQAHSGQFKPTHSSLWLKANYYYHSWVQSVSDIWLSGRRQVELLTREWLSAFQFNAKPRSAENAKNILPTVGNIQFRKLSSGLTPKTQFYIDQLSDTDGTISRVKWNFGDGTSAEMFSGEFNNQAFVSHIYPTAGHYVLSFEAEDNQGGITSKSVYIDFSENKRPELYFTAVADSVNPLTVYFQILSNDSDSEQTSTFTMVCPSGGTSLKAFTCTFPSAGVYNLSIWSTDGDMAEIKVDTAITVGGSVVNAKPVGVIDVDMDSGTAPLTVTFDATESFDIDGTIRSYDWNFGEFRTADVAKNGVKVKKTFTKPGTYFVKLIVKDDLENESTVYKEINVFPSTLANQAPKIYAMNYAPLKLNFWTERTAFPMSIDSNMIFWDFGDGQKSNSLWVSEHTYAAPGTYNVSLKVISLKGETTVTQKTITVGQSVDAINSGWITANRATAKPYDQLSYTSNATDPQGQALTFDWFFFDGSTSSGATTQFQYSYIGYKVVDLIITNSRGISAFVSTHTEVVSDYNILIPRLTYTPAVGAAPLLVQFDASQSSSNAGKIVSYQWSVNEEYFSLEPTASKNFTQDGIYYLRLILTDEFGNQAGSEEQIVVNSSAPPSNNVAPNAVISSYFDGINPRLLLFNCYSSTDDQYVAHCAWKINGEPLVDTKSGQVLLSENINYVLELIVTDPYGVKNSKTAVYNFTPQPINIVDFDYFPLSPITGQSIKFGGEQSVVNGPISAYTWAFGDSTTATGSTTSHTYSNPGTYTVKLTVKSGTTNYNISKSIVVAPAASTTGLRLVARAPNQSGFAYNGATFRALKFPETIQFTAESLTTAEGEFSDGVWNMGNGDVALGENIEYTYFKPGTYAVTYTGKTPSGSTVTSSLTVVVPSDVCMVADEQTFCLNFDTGNDNILSLNHLSWTVTHNLGGTTYSKSSSVLVPGWIQLVALDGSEVITDLSDAVTISSNQLFLSREKILQKNIDLSLPYKIKVQTKSGGGSPLVGESPEFYFGGSQLAIHVSAADATLEVVHSGAQWRRYYSLAGTVDKLLTDLPAGSYAVVATRGAQKSVRIVQLKAEERGQLNIDLDQAWPSLKKRKPIKLSWMQNIDQSNPPAWTQGLCGESSPFKQSEVRAISTGEIFNRAFTSLQPAAQFQFANIERNTPKNLTLSCAIQSPSLLYAHNKWKYKDGPGRCYENSSEHPNWKIFLSSMNRESQPIVVAYEVKDAWSSQVIKGHFVTSARDNMLKEGLSLDDLTSRIGLGTDSSQDFAQRFYAQIRVPVHFRRPQVRFYLVSDHNSSNTEYYSVNCNVIDNVDKPVISELTAVSTNALAATIHYNARISLTKGFNFFPINYDSRANSAAAITSALSQARYYVKIQRHDYKTVTWQGVRVTYNYGVQSYEQFYPFTSSAQTNSFDRTYLNTIDINTADLANRFSWQPGVKTISLNLKPIGKITNDYDFVGESKVYNFVPLIDLQTVRDSNSLLCSEGFFQTPLSTFVRDDLLQSLIASETQSVRTRCGDAALPFGGLFRVNSAWRYKGHKDANSIHLRTFNASGEQDSYDDLTNFKRLADVNEYLNFSNQAKAIAAITTELDQNLQPTSKKILYDFCHPQAGLVKIPCTDSTVFADLDHDMVLKICQWNMNQAVMPVGCPVIDVSKLMRYARWAEMNAVNMSVVLSKAQAKLTVSSGGMLNLALTGYRNHWQKDAIVYGVWPDGKPIWKVAANSTTLFNERLLRCHGYSNGCYSLNSNFSNQNFYFDKILFNMGWN